MQEDKKGQIVFEHVSFAYPGADEKTLHDIDFTANKGETVAFIGSTGSGKSTLVNLIPRFFDVTEGRILVDGVDIRNLKLHDLRERIGYVPQKAVLFSGTIDSNIRYGKEEATEAEVKKAAQIAQAWEFIEEKEDGVKDATTLIVAQRISTILHADKILVLDEGRVVGQGTHKELLKSCQVYRQIAMSQLSEEELANE